MPEKKYTVLIEKGYSVRLETFTSDYYPPFVDTSRQPRELTAYRPYLNGDLCEAYPLGYLTREKAWEYIAEHLPGKQDDTAPLY